MSSQKRRTYSDGFKRQIFSLYESAKSPSELIKEYDLSPASIYQWCKQYGSESDDDVTVYNKESIADLQNQGKRKKNLNWKLIF